MKKNRKDYAFWSQLNEKPSRIPCCPGSIDAQAGLLCPMQLANERRAVAFVFVSKLCSGLGQC